MQQFLFLSAIALIGASVTGCAADAIDVDEVKRAYAVNNQADLPVVRWLTWGTPKFILYPDGELIVPNSRAKSRMGKANLSPQDFSAAAAKIGAQLEFWKLAPSYRLTRQSEQPLNIVSLRLPGREAITVRVYGPLTARSKDDESAPTAFTSFLDVLNSLIPPDTVPWDPGYVEIGWGAYDYAPDGGLDWPKLEGPLARPVKPGVTQWIVLFPSSLVDDLDAFLARRLVRGAIVIDGRKVSGSYHWPMRGEKAWTMNQ